MAERAQILVLRFSSLGDVILCSVLLDALREVHPDAHLTWVTKAVYADLFRDDPRVDELLLLDESTPLRSLWRQLESRSLDLVIDAHGSLRSRALCAALPPTRLRRLAKDTFERLLLLRAGVRRPTLRRRHVDRCLDLVPEASRSHRPRLLGVSQAPPSWLPGGGPVLAVAPGARHDPKRWPLERFARVLRPFQQEHGARIVLVGGEADRPLCAELVGLTDAEVVDASGDRPLGEVASALRSCQALLCNDSGLLHMAEAVGTPAVAIYGPTTRDWGYFPLDPRSRVLEVDLPCRPCSRNGGRPCHLDEQLCMTLVREDDVLSALDETWKPSPNAVPH